MHHEINLLYMLSMDYRTSSCNVLLPAQLLLCKSLYTNVAYILHTIASGHMSMIEQGLVCNENFGAVPKMERGSNFILQNLAWARK